MKDLQYGDPVIEIEIRLSRNQKVLSRTAYTLFDLLGDFGGFNDAIYLLFSVPMSFYSSAMFKKFIANQSHDHSVEENDSDLTKRQDFIGKLRSDDKITTLDSKEK